MVTAIITAAGMGTRLGSPIPKALIRVGEFTLIEWTLLAFQASEIIDEVVVTVPEGMVDTFVSPERQVFSGSLRITEGGSSRQESVHNALIQAATTGPVLIHDAARCFASPTLIRRVAGLVDSQHPAIVPALPVTDTIKIVGEGDPAPVLSTPVRADLRAVQTPQGFMGDTLWRAHQKFKTQGNSEATAATDDAQLVEWLGEPSFVCAGDPSAFKITTAQDLKFAAEFVESGIEWAP